MKYSNVQNNVKYLLAEIASHAASVHRDPSQITLIAVTKYATIEEMQQAYDAGIRNFGEQRLQTALEKMSHFPNDVIWHFIGPLQSNKIKKIARHFSYIHSVESMQNALDIAKWGNNTKVFLQVNISKQPQESVFGYASQETARHGFTPEQLLQEYPALAQIENLTLCGLMTMAPHTTDTAAITHCFTHLAALQKQLQLPYLSMGMSQDFAQAIAHGATHLRIGSLLFGH